MTTIQKPVEKLEVGDVILGIATTMFTEPHTIVQVKTYRWDGEVIPCAAITDKGGFYPYNDLGHHMATVAA